MPSRWEKIKETVILILLSVILPSVDVFSDGGVTFVFFRGSRHNPYCDQEFEARRIISWGETLNCYYNDSVPTSNVTYTSHVGWGSMMLVPLLLNYLICWYVWATTDKRKAVTWIAALFSFYPQFVACKIIWLIWSDSKKGLKKKQHLERDLVQIETFVEAVPSTITMTYLFIRKLQEAEGHQVIFDDHNDKDFILFLVAYLTSIISSSLGLAKSLKVGPCRILPEQKRCLRGLLSPRFILIFFACGFSLVAKGFGLAGGVQALEGGDFLAGGGALALSTFFLPGFLTGLFACWHKGILKTFLVHPSVFLLPVFSSFTFASNSKVCCGGGGQTEDTENGPEAEKDETFITFSPKYTVVNAGLSAVGVLAFVFAFPLIQNLQPLSYWDTVLPIVGTPFILGLLPTLAATFSNRCTCCRSCCCSCCDGSFDLGALLPSAPRTQYILGSDGQLRKQETGIGSNVEVFNVEVASWM